MKTFIGIMDAHGLESFLEKNRQTSAQESADNYVLLSLKMRADANIHRHAFVYQVEVDEQQEQTANDLIKKEDWKQACTYLKSLESFACRIFCLRKITHEIS